MWQFVAVAVGSFVCVSLLVCLLLARTLALLGRDLSAFSELDDRTIQSFQRDVT